MHKAVLFVCELEIALEKRQHKTNMIVLKPGQLTHLLLKAAANVRQHLHETFIIL